MNTKQLKAKVLDLAIHGKLLSPETVAELKKSPDYETADILLEKIRKEKEEKIAKGELKRDKKDSYIFVGDDNRHYEKFADGTVKDIEDEIPFDVPESWSIIHLQHIGSFQGGQTPKSNETTDEGTIPYFKVSDMNVLGNELYMNKVSLYLSDSAKYKVFPPDSIIYPKNGGAVFTNKKRILTVNSLIDLNTGAYIPSKLVDNIYAYYLFSTIDFNKFYKGTSVPTVDHDSICELFFGLPPLVEQKEIVKQLAKVFNNINILEEEKAILQETVSKTKSKVLDLAIHGKLVPQDANDEPASVLLEKLRAEKEEKIAKGELKRDKNDSYIYKGSDNCHYQKFINGNETDITDEIPFEIPDNWSWCNLGEIYSHTTGKALKKENNKGTLRKYITTSNLYWNCFDFTDVRTMYFTDDELEKCTIKKGDLVLCNGGDVGRAAIWKLDEDICYQNHVSRLRPRLSGINNSFYLYVIQINKEKGNLSGKGVGITSLSATDILNLKIPLPPLAEQKRIVDKIENAFAKLDQIAEQLA